MNIAIVGATGNVGRKILEVLEKLNFKFEQLYLKFSFSITSKSFLPTFPVAPTIAIFILIKVLLLFYDQF